MQSPQRRWRLYRLAQACSCRPSDLLGVENSYVAYCLDEAIVTFGEALEHELEKVAHGAKNERAAEGAQKMTLEKWLKLGAYAEVAGEKKQQFRNPVATK